MKSEDQLEFDVEHHPQTSEYNTEYYSLHVPHDIYDDAEELDEGRYRVLTVYEGELKDLYTKVSNMLEKLERKHDRKTKGKTK